MFVSALQTLPSKPARGGKRGQGGEKQTNFLTSETFVFGQPLQLLFV